MIAKITLSGLDRYVSAGAFPGFNDLWDLFNVPDGINRQLLIDSIKYRALELPLVYMSAPAVREQLGHLCELWYDSMDRTFKALTAEYNPIHNFDRYEDTTDNRTTSGTGKTTSNEKDKSASDSNTEQYYMGDTAADYNPAQKTTSNGNGTTETIADIQNTTTAQDDNKHAGHLYGNIGVTTSQQMLTAEIDLRMKYSFYDVWALAFVKELCVGIY